MFNHYIFVCFCTANQSSDGYFPYETDSNDHTLTKGKIVGIIIACVILCIFCVAVTCACVHRLTRKNTSNRKITPSQHNQNVGAQNYSMTTIHRNTTRANGTHVPYTIPMSAAPVAIQEELPPSYESYMSSLTVQEQRNFNQY
jgi:hypothetical protein